MKTTHLTEEASVNAMEVKKRGQLSYIWFRFRKNKLAMFGLLLLLAMALICITAPLYLDYDRDVVTQHVMEKFAPPLSEGHLMGTDHYGRDMLARIVYGGRISLTMGFAIVSLSLLFGGMIGALAGYYGGWVDNVLMRLMDVFLAIPQILMAMAIVRHPGPADYRAPYPPQCHRPDCSPGDAADRPVHHQPGGAELHRPGRAVAPAGVGDDALGGQTGYAPLPLRCAGAGDCHHAGGALLQSDGRRPAGCAGPEAEELMRRGTANG